MEHQNDLFNKTNKLNKEEELKRIDLNANLYKAKTIKENNDFINIDDNLNNTIKSNVETDIKTKEYNRLNDYRDKLYNSNINLIKSQAEYNYNNTPEFVKLEKDIIDLEKQTLENELKTKQLERLNEGRKQLDKSIKEHQFSKHVLNNNNNNNNSNNLDQIIYYTNKLAEAESNAANTANKYAEIIGQINYCNSILSNEDFTEFHNANPKYLLIYNTEDLSTIPLEFLKYSNDLSNYINYKNKGL